MIVHKGKGSGARATLGKSGEEVTIILANSPGGLELLPNKLYRTNDGSGQWLRYNKRLGGIAWLPKSDPYREIYRAKKPAYRLVHEEWLGQHTDVKDNSGYDQQTHDPWHYYSKNLNKAEAFHESLKDILHPETFQFFSTGIKTADRVDIKCSHVTKDGIYSEAHRYKGFWEVVDGKGEKQSLDDLLYISAFSEDTYKDTVLHLYTLEPPTGTGDGTVPDASAIALKAKPTGYTPGPEGTVDISDDDESWFDRQHDGVYKTKTAQKITLKAIENLCKTKIKKETGTG
jgi:hypothetical protein